LIITVEVHAIDFGHFTRGGKMNSAGGSLCPTKSDDDVAPKVRHEIGIRGHPSAAEQSAPRKEIFGIMTFAITIA
jgi:hypothetical protein